MRTVVRLSGIEHLMANTVRPLASRILGRNHLEAIQMEVMTEYLNHHTRVAGSTNRFFSDEAVFAIHKSSGDYCEGPIPWQKQPLWLVPSRGIRPSQPNTLELLPPSYYDSSIPWGYAAGLSIPESLTTVRYRDLLPKITAL